MVYNIVKGGRAAKTDKEDIMAKNKGGSIGLIALLIVLAMLVVAIVGVCIDWVGLKAYGGIGGIGGETDTAYQKLGDLFETYGEAEGETAGAFKAMASFAILTVILAAATTVLAGICKVLGWKLFKFVLVVAAIACVVCGVVTIITSYTFCDKLSAGVDLGGVAQAGTEATPAVGMWLTSIGGALAGLVGVVAAVKS